MQDFKVIVKEWLKSIDKNRKWLGEQLEATPKRTVDRWLSPSSDPVPAWAELGIKNLMTSISDAKEGQKEKETVENQENSITIEFSDQDMEIINRFLEVFPDWDLTNYAYTKVIELCIGLDQAAKTDEKSAPEHPHSGSLSSAG